MIPTRTRNAPANHPSKMRITPLAPPSPTLNITSPFPRTQALPSIKFRGSEPSLSPASQLTYLSDEPRTLNEPLPADFPKPEPFACFVAQAGLEVLIGQRPAHQLQPWFARSLYFAFMRRTSHMLTSTHTPSTPQHFKVQRVRCVKLLERVLEATVLVRCAQKLHAVALRIEVQHGKWRVTAFESA